MKKIHATFVLSLLVLVACNKLDTYEYIADSGVSISVTLKGVKHAAEQESSFLFCDVEIENHTQKAVFFNVGDMKARMNGKLSEAAYYDSYASVLPEPERLGEGSHLYRIYFVFAGTLDSSELQEFDLVNLGIGG